jgi:hypothetical protein
VRTLAQLIEKEPTSAFDDDEIRECVLAELEKTAWAPHAGTVVVTDGIVELGGESPTKRSVRGSVSPPRMCVGSGAFAIASFGSSQSLQLLSRPQGTSKRRNPWSYGDENARVSQVVEHHNKVSTRLILTALLIGFALGQCRDLRGHMHKRRDSYQRLVRRRGDPLAPLTGERLWRTISIAKQRKAA